MTAVGRRRRPNASSPILDFLAEHPHDRFGLSELARRLGLSKPTCLGIVTTLTDVALPGPRRRATRRIGLGRH